MLKKDIKVGKMYRAKVNGQFTTVRVDSIKESLPRGAKGRIGTVYFVTNLSTNRNTVFRSAAKFLNEVGMEPPRLSAKQRESAEAMAVAVVERVETLNKVVQTTPSVLQQTIIKRQTSQALNRAPHVIVEARAGTGKTTTLVEGLKLVRGMLVTLKPSPQQAAVWEAMAASSGVAQSVCFCAFNKSIADELQRRVPHGCQAMTTHSMGRKAVVNAFGNIQVEQYRTENLLADVMECDLRELKRNYPVIISAVNSLVDKAKQNLVGIDPTGNWMSPDDPDWNDELTRLAAHYDIDLNGSADRIFKLVPQVLDQARRVDQDRQMDFTDMIWLPIVLNLPIYRYDLLLVDEAQDLNRCQQELALRAGTRLILCGDPRQAIYGFAGADADSMPRMLSILQSTDRGCVTLPLTVTRRCGKAIVAEAQKIVPDFEAFETNPTGLVGRMKLNGVKPNPFPIVLDGVPNSPADDPTQAGYEHSVKDGDFILCRVNAPLVSQCFRFLKEGRKANIQGRDIGSGLISTIKRMKATTIVDLIGKLDDWYHAEVRKETAKRNPSESRLIALKDRLECLQTMCDAVAMKYKPEDPDKTPDDVIRKINDIFTNETNGEGIRLSSIHKAKGLESHRVFILLPKGGEMPHPMAKSPWQIAQEMNLKYVAITRAITELYYVS